MNNNHLPELNLFLLGDSLKKLGEKIQRQITDVCKSRGVNFDPKLFPVLFYLNKYEKSTVQNLAEVLIITHPAVVNLLKKLKNLNLIELTSGKQDKRQTYSTLTEKGKELFKSWQNLFNLIENVNKDLVDELGYNIFNMISSFHNLLKQKNYNKRIQEKVKQSVMNQIEIITYNKKYNDIFKKLNYEWLEEYFSVEPEDEKLLNNPEKYIIKKGGEIFFARINNEIIGTCAAIKIDKHSYELSKMAVTKKAQGKQAGKKLALSVIGFAFSKKAKYVTLLTNKKLFAAINLYKQLGFEIDTTIENKIYNRELFRMTLLLQ